VFVDGQDLSESSFGECPTGKIKETSRKLTIRAVTEFQPAFTFQCTLQVLEILLAIGFRIIGFALTFGGHVHFHKCFIPTRYG